MGFDKERVSALLGGTAGVNRVEISRGVTIDLCEAVLEGVDIPTALEPFRTTEALAFSAPMAKKLEIA